MDTPAKCARCSAPIMDRELVYFDRGDLIHVRCWSERASPPPGERARRPEDPPDKRGEGAART